MKTAVSVIIPCYKQGDFLEEAVQSVLSQSFSQWECIIVDDGSPDNTEEVAKELCKLDARIRYMKKTNGGLASARNAGIELAKGEFILPLDADDKIAERYLEEAMMAFESNPQLKLVYCEAEKFGAVSGSWELEPYSYPGLLRCNMIFCTAFFRKSDWERAGGYDEVLKSGWEDWAFWLKILDANSMVYRIPSVLFYYRIKVQSMLTTMQTQHQRNVRWFVIQQHISKYKELYADPISLTEENEHLQALVQKLKTSNSYRLGNLLLKPFSYLKGSMNRQRS